MQDSQHIVSAFDKELFELERLVTEMAGLVEHQIEEAIKGLTTRDLEISEKVIELDRKVDGLENDIDQAAVRLLALRQPQAQDLRASLGVLKVSSNLERMGDYAKNIGKRNRVLISSPPIDGTFNTIKRMGVLISSMINDVVDAYLKRDGDKAEDVRLRDAEVDALHNTLFRELLTHMMEDPRHITPSMHLLFIAKNIERIGDHITAIAEQVIYIVTGQTPDEPRPKSDNTAFVAIKPEQ